MHKKVMVAMSGGVDSSVAAALLKSQGYEVIGLTMCFNLPSVRSEAPGRASARPSALSEAPGRASARPSALSEAPGRASARPACCGAQSISDAKRVADILGIRHYVLNFGKDLQKFVVQDFVRQYSRGLTPNPCVRCNELIKFEILLNKALGLGMDYLATGHYARIEKQGRRYFLKKARDLKKDQSYFLYRLNQNKLKRILFPLGGLTKGKVRKLALKFKLPVAEKEDSQEICFISGNYREFLKSRLKNKFSPGPIVDGQGKILGQHKGIPFYTIGQRDKLGIACGHPVYVTKIDAGRNELVVGEKDEACGKIFLVNDLVYPSGTLKKQTRLMVRIRHLSRQEPAWVSPIGRKVKVEFIKPNFAITPGQSAVFYDKDTVAGGGIIEEVLQ